METKIDEAETMTEENWVLPKEDIREVIEKARSEDRHQLMEDEAREILELAGIDMAEGKVVKDIESCVETAENLGYPVVLKVVSEDIVHKMDVGGIALGLESKDEVEEAYQALHSRVKDRKPDANIRGISIAEMVENDTEVVIGGMTDATFGPVVMFGLGGIYVEIFEDVEFRIAPLSNDEAHRMMSDIDSFPLLTGARGKRCKDLDALAEMITRVSQLMYELEEIQDIDLNPVAALNEEAKALDVSISLK